MLEKLLIKYEQKYTSFEWEIEKESVSQNGQVLNYVDK